MPHRGCHHGNMLRYETDDRWYLIWLLRDLWGNPVILRAWGGKKNRLGGSSQEAVAPGQSALAQLRAVCKRRRQHGYKLVTPPFARPLPLLGTFVRDTPDFSDRPLHH